MNSYVDWVILSLRRLEKSDGDRAGFNLLLFNPDEDRAGFNPRLFKLDDNRAGLKFRFFNGDENLLFLYRHGSPVIRTEPQERRLLSAAPFRLSADFLSAILTANRSAPCHVQAALNMVDQAKRDSSQSANALAELFTCEIAFSSRTCIWHHSQF